MHNCVEFLKLVVAKCSPIYWYKQMVISARGRSWRWRHLQNSGRYRLYGLQQAIYSA